MLGWLKARLSRPSPLELWTVSVSADAIATSDGLGTSRSLAIEDLRRVVVATDDSGPWGADVVFLLYSGEEKPVGIFPLEAQGRDAFLDWLEVREGYDPEQLVRAMGSTDIARFTIYRRPGVQPE